MYGVDFDVYAEQANQDIAVVVQIEHIEGVKHIGDILRVEGIDGVFVGPYDLSGSLGILGQMDHPKMVDSLKKITDACQEHHIPADVHVVQVELDRIQHAIDSGFHIIALSVNYVLLYAGMRYFYEQARRLSRS